MQDKHKVTLYLPPELHRQLKIKSAVEAEPMSAIAERAIVFYLTHSEVVDEVEQSHGHVHQVYECPGCQHPYVIREGELVALSNQMVASQSVISEEEELSVPKVVSLTSDAPNLASSVSSQGEEALVPC